MPPNVYTFSRDPNNKVKKILCFDNMKRIFNSPCNNNKTIKLSHTNFSQQIQFLINGFYGNFIIQLYHIDKLQ